LYDPAIDTNIESVSDPVVAFPASGVPAPQKLGAYVDLTVPTAGPVVVDYTITYDATKGRVTETRRLVILVK
jgi:hypothetical protein